MITTIIFDMNGVIIDDEAIHELAFRKVCQGFEVNLTPKLYLELCMGRTDKAGFEDIIKKFSLGNIDVNQLVAKKSQKYLEMLPNFIKSYPGAIDKIKTLSQDFRLALTSSSNIDEVKMVISVFKIKDFFEVIVAANDVEKSKPHPEPYLLTAEKLGEKPANCLVIEDSSNGVLSAKAAGMRCIAIATTHNKKDLTESDLVIENFSELTKDVINKY